MERETGFEPATSTLARSHSTTELFPPAQTKERTTADPALARRAPFFVAYNPIAPPGRAPHPPPPPAVARKRFGEVSPEPSAKAETVSTRAESDRTSSP